MASFGISFCAQHLSEVGGDSEDLGQLEIGISPPTLHTTLCMTNNYIPLAQPRKIAVPRDKLWEANDNIPHDNNS